MKRLFFVFILCLAPFAMAQNVLNLPVVSSSVNVAEVQNVELGSVGFKTLVDKWGNFETRSIIINLKIKAVASECETMKEILSLSPQSSLDSALNPSDFYYRVLTSWKPDCVTGSYGPPVYINLPLEFFIDQRRATEAGKPWPKPEFKANQNVRHLSFDVGMMRGFNRWSLYKLDYGNLDKVKFEFIKTYSYVQGQSVNN